MSCSDCCGCHINFEVFSVLCNYLKKIHMEFRIYWWSFQDFFNLYLDRKYNWISLLILITIYRMADFVRLSSPYIYIYIYLNNTAVKLILMYAAYRDYMSQPRNSIKWKQYFKSCKKCGRIETCMSYYNSFKKVFIVSVVPVRILLLLT